jgi:8-hydroxy-5-deazaflavin:NADPH oxidoreductase
MKIGIIGTGNIGRSLGILWAEQGHDVFFGSCDTERAQSAARLAHSDNQSRTIGAGSNDEAARFGDVLLYTVQGVPPEQVLSDISVLKDKILIDPNNANIPENFFYEPIILALAEKLQWQAPLSRVVKAFNTIAQEVFELSLNPLRGERVSVFVAGDDEAARQIVMGLSTDIGFEPVDCGPLRNARLIEGLADILRYVAIRGSKGAYTAITIQSLPKPEHAARLGGRLQLLGQGTR